MAIGHNAADGQRRAKELSSLDRGLQILSFVQDRGWADAAEIIAALDVPSSSTYRYLRLLRKAGYLSEIDGKLMPSARLADRSEDRSGHLIDAARPVLTRLARRSGLNVALTVRVHTAALCLDTRRSGSGSMAFRPGEILTLYSGASATPLLAAAPEIIQRQVLRGGLRRMTAATPDTATLRAELAAAVGRGYHLTRGWLTPGMTAVGMPVTVGGSCLCAVSVSGRDADLAEHAAAAELLRRTVTDLVAALPQSPADAWAPPDPEGVFR